MKAPSRLLTTILLASAIWSCHTSRHTSAELAVQTSATAADTSSALVEERFLSLVNTVRDMQLWGIEVEFFPPDSLHPSAVPAPKSLSIQKAAASESTDTRCEETTSAEFSTSSHIDTDSTSTAHNVSECDRNVFHPPRWAAVLALVGAAVVIALSLRRKANSR